MNLRTLGIVTALAISLPGLALAKPPGNQGGHGNHGNHDNHAAHGGNQHGGAPCPPGLAKKSPACVPPGQWKKGDILPSSWTGSYTRYSGLPEIFRDRYADRRDRRYVYQNDRVFVVDVATRAIVDILTR